MNGVPYNIWNVHSCPDIIEIVALLKGAYPDWSLAAIKAALTTAAYSYENMNKREVEMVDEAT